MTQMFPVRKTQIIVEEVHHDLGPAPAEPVWRGAALAVVANPYVGEYVADFAPASDELRALGETLGGRLRDALGGAERIDSYGKGAIVGTRGEIEHGAVWHIPGGTGMREALGKGESIVPSTKKVGALGARLDVPLTHLAWSYVGSHYDAIEVGIGDAPRDDEIVFILTMGIGGRVHARLAGGFTLDDRGRDDVPV